MDIGPGSWGEQGGKVTYTSSDDKGRSELLSEGTSGFDYWKSKLGGARLILAPMVEQSELAWRMLSRRYGADLCYTPMLHASTFVKDQTYRKENLVTCAEDRPLLVQFCSNDSETFVKAAQLAAPYCDGIDLNLGCPQTIARRGFYGAFLQEDWNRIYNMVFAASQHVSVPISCKIRVFKDVDKTVRYASMIEKAGCKLLTVHGRTREQKGPNTGLASWEHIAAVKRCVNIPVFANGNVQLHEDIEKCFCATGVDGVMIAEGSLHNPALFAVDREHYPSWKFALEYLDVVDKYPCPFSCIRAHFFKLFHYRAWLAKAGSLVEFRQIAEMFKIRTEVEHEKYQQDPSCYDCAGLLFPHWICQPYYRPENYEYMLFLKSAQK